MLIQSRHTRYNILGNSNVLHKLSPVNQVYIIYPNGLESNLWPSKTGQYHELQHSRICQWIAFWWWNNGRFISNRFRAVQQWGVQTDEHTHTTQHTHTHKHTHTLTSTHTHTHIREHTPTNAIGENAPLEIVAIDIVRPSRIRRGRAYRREVWVHYALEMYSIWIFDLENKGEWRWRFGWQFAGERTLSACTSMQKLALLGPAVCSQYIIVQ